MLSRIGLLKAVGGCCWPEWTSSPIPGRDPSLVRLATLLLWNNVLAYALKHPEVLAADVPDGIDMRLFRAMTIDYMVEVGLSKLKFTQENKEHSNDR